MENHENQIVVVIEPTDEMVVLMDFSKEYTQEQLSFLSRIASVHRPSIVLRIVIIMELFFLNLLDKYEDWRNGNVR
jgi:hypothetical protein